jgi:tellurite resistance protein TerC
MHYYFQHPLFLIGFAAIILIMLVLDLGFFNKNPHAVSNKEAITWSAVWIGLAMCFSLVIWKTLGFHKFSDFQSAYWIEKALSVDNLFVFIIVFRFFKVPKEYHHEVLFWGIIGALVMRGIFIFAGVQLIALTYLPATDLGGLLAAPVRINMVLTIFGLILIYAAYKSAFKNDVEAEEKQNFNQQQRARIIHKLFRIVPEFDGGKFFTIRNGVRVGTQLLVVLAVIEFTDLIFAVDSIPAIFAITDDPFILYTSNIFAILGLRSLYFILANFIHLFHYLKYGLAIILAFIGLKMLISPVIHISSPVSLLVVAVILIGATVASLLIQKKPDETIPDKNNN